MKSVKYRKELDGKTCHLFNTTIDTFKNYSGVAIHQDIACWKPIEHKVQFPRYINSCFT